MRRTWFSLAGLTAFGLLLGSPALAQEKPKPKEDKPAPKKDEPKKTEHAKPADVATAMKTDKLDLSSAVAAAEAHSKGHAVAAWGDVKDGHANVTVHCVVGDKCMACTVDQTGKVTGMTEATADDDKHTHNATGAEVWKAMDGAKMTLAKSIDADAAEHKGATMVSATAKMDKGQPEVYFTCVAADGKVMKSEVDKSGKVHERKAGGDHDKKDDAKKDGEKKP